MISLSMEKKFTPRNNQGTKFSDDQYKRYITDHNRVDINILLNRVKLQKAEIKKRNIVFVICTIVSVSASAYLIF